MRTFASRWKRRSARQSRRPSEERPAEPSEPSKPAEKDPNAKEYEVDFDIKNTSETKTINGFDTKKSVITITVREKGKTLNDAGGLVMTTDTWLAGSAPSTKELAEFERKYAQQIYGPMVVGASPQDMAMALAVYPQMKQALDKMAAEGAKLQGTAILTDMRVEAVPPGTANQASAAPPPPEEPKKKGLGGMLGGLKKMAEAVGEESELGIEAAARHHHDDVGRNAEAHDGRRCGVRRDACGFQGDEVVTSSCP